MVTVLERHMSNGPFSSLPPTALVTSGNSLSLFHVLNSLVCKIALIISLPTSLWAGF